MNRYVITYFLADKTIAMFPTCFYSQQEAQTYIDTCYKLGQHLDKELRVIEYVD